MTNVEATTGYVFGVYEYDGNHHRIVKDAEGTYYDRHYYYNDKWQVIAETKNGSTFALYVWHLYYIDALAVRMRARDMHYFLHDANFNVTAAYDITSGSGTDRQVVERYAYSPYGEVTFLDANFSVDADQESDIDNYHLYTGRERDPETGLQLNRKRWYIPPLARFANRDPSVYKRRKNKNLYEYTGSMPTRYGDPLGLDYIEVGDNGGVYWVVEEDGFWYNSDGQYHLIGVIDPQSGAVHLRPPYGNWWSSVEYLEQIADRFWNEYGDASQLQYAGQQNFIAGALGNDALAWSASSTQCFCRAYVAGGNAGSASLDYYLTRPTNWLFGLDFGTEAAYYWAWQQSGLAGTDIQSYTDWAAGIGVGSAYSAIAVWGWGAAGWPTYGAGFVQTSESSVMFSVNGQFYMGTANGVYNVTGAGYAQFGYWSSITGWPIINPTAAAAGAGSAPLWFPNHPCFSQALQGFVNGFIPYLWR